MKKDSYSNLEVENISNIDNLVSWWKKINHNDQSNIATLCTFKNYLKKLFKESSCSGKLFGIALLSLLISLILSLTLALTILITIHLNAVDMFKNLMPIINFLYIVLPILLVFNSILILLTNKGILRIVTPNQHQSKYNLFHKAINKYDIDVEKLASYCNKKVVEIDTKTKEYQAYWKTFTLTILASSLLPLLLSFQNFIFKIYEKENINDISILLNALRLYWALLFTILLLLFLVYIVGVFFVSFTYRSHTNRKTYYSLFVLSNNSMIF